MIRWIGAAMATSLALSVGLGAGAARAADELYLSIYASPAADYVDPSTGGGHAFLCLSHAAGAAAAEDVCYGFFARPEAVTSITLRNGGTLKRTTGQDWVESPGGYHFVQQPTPADNIVLTDGTRQLTWVLASPYGGSQMGTPTAKQPGPRIKSITVAAGGPGFIGSGHMTAPYQELVLRPEPGGVTFQQKITTTQLADLIKAIDAWNGARHGLDRDGYISAIAAVTAGIGDKTPPRKARMTVADYVTAVAALNR